ncbi:hypothetical protein RM697_08610 [Ichthyenterobacterium sp. W332]|uniref:Uncharacterized protein n=1 Tax=Microcosmobacter mediterraneus TaxID=3075607 RepID=A0ABU2YKN4_9FLAO|nr:hypothetical protein [Ichthyenterobacterium sp. W332]MDT0558706.1 hypothetical protein [Ichthyenterobacterium sp. W332]
MTEATIKEGKLLACVAYIPLFGVLIAYILNNNKKNPFTSFHVRQGLGLFLFYLICAVSVSNLDSPTLRLWLWYSFIGLFIIGFGSALLGKTYVIPIIGNYIQKTFKNLGS